MFSVLTDFDRVRVERFKQTTEDKLRDVRCPDHRQAPRIRARAYRASQYAFRHL